MYDIQNVIVKENGSQKYGRIWEISGKYGIFWYICYLLQRERVSCRTNIFVIVKKKFVLKKIQYKKSHLICRFYFVKRYKVQYNKIFLKKFVISVKNSL